jgi:DNA-binding beta-propeller fold protein YncE
MALIAAAATLATLALLAIASRAHASETIYWDNYGATPTTIGFANIDGTAGGVLNLANVAAPGAEVEIDSPEGIAYDPLNGRIYVASSSNDEIVWVSTDGSGAGVLDTGAVPVEDPEGIAVDPATQTVYWANSEITGSIGYAAAAGGGAGLLNTAGASIDDPYKIALDTVHGRVYWAGENGIVSYANLDGSGGADLPLPEAERPGTWSAINVDPATNRLYFIGQFGPTNGAIYWVSTIGLGGGEIEIEGPAFNDPYGLAFDPPSGRFYWANYGNGEERENAFGTTTLTPGVVAGITVATAPLDSPQDPVIVKSPIGTGAPSVTAAATKLSCSQGNWVPDYPGSYVYAAPTGFAYQWLKDGQAISGATGASYTATASGSYSCTVTATNRSGSASQASAGVRVTIAAPKPIEPPKPKPKPVTPAILSLKPISKKPVKAKAGKVAVVKVDLANGGGTAYGAVKVCGKLNKKAKKGLVAPKCVSVASIPAGQTVVAKLRVKTRKSAKGLYKFRVLVKGAVVKSMTAKVRVIAPKHKKHKKHPKHKK